MPPPLKRSQAVDTLRGMTLALMIVVNMSINGKSYGPLLHAAWHGLTLTDLVFPMFLFVVGTSLSFTLDRYAELGDAAVLARVARRTLLLFLCGFLLYWFPFIQPGESGHLELMPLANTRILGVLQRIALAYCAASLIVHLGKSRGAVAFSLVALLGAWLILSAFGDLTLQGNAALKLDRLVLGESHLYRGEGVPFDPEGILGTLPAIVNVLAGVLAARLLRERGERAETVASLLLAGAVCVLVAVAWSEVLPFNKKLWTSSYALCNVGIDLAVLASLLYVIELRGLRRWTSFFEVFGRNPLFIYLLSEVLVSILWRAQVSGAPMFLWLYTHGFQSWAGDKPGSLAYSLVFMFDCWLVAYALDRRRIYLRL